MMILPISCLILLVTAVPCYSVSFAEIERTSLNVFVGTCVEIRCKVTGVLPDEDALWFWMKDGEWDEGKLSGTIVYSNKPTEQHISPQFRGRVNYTGSTRLVNRASFSNNPSCSVRICDLTEQDSGEYFFRYISKKWDFKWSTNNAVITVTAPPTSLTLSMDSEVTEGQNVSITCRVDSSPVSTLTLSRTSQGSPVELLRDTEHNSLIYSVTVTSAHSGEYTCSSHNSVGSDSTKRSLTVKYAPQKVRVQADPGLMVKENTTLTLHCSALSHPPVSSVTWSRGPMGQESLVHTGPTFSVSSVSVNDSGLYSCTAHNQLGQGTSPPAEVQVMFGPNQAVVLRAEEEQDPDGSSSVTLSCSSHSFPPVNLYTWYRRTEDGELKVSENINYTVLSTQPGVYYCTAKNQISESTSEPVSLFLQESFVKYTGLALVPLLIILCAFIVYRLKIKRSVEGERTNKPWWRSCSKALGRWHSSRGCSEDVHAETPGRRDVPPPQQRADVMNSTSSANAPYSTVNLPKHKQSRPGTSDENIASFFYASVHFDKNPSTLIPKEREEVVYSTVKKHHEEAGDVYENVRKKADCSAAADSSEDEVDVSYSEVNFRRKVTAAEEEYSELNF